MAKLEEPTRRDLFSFGLGLPVFVTLLGLLIAHRFAAPNVARGIWIGGGALVVLYWIVPRSRSPIYAAWMRAVYPIGWVVTTTLLVLIYWLVVTPIALLVRTFGTDPLDRAPDPAANTYWVTRENVTDDERYLQQF